MASTHCKDDQNTRIVEMSGCWQDTTPQDMAIILNLLSGKVPGTKKVIVNMKGLEAIDEAALTCLLMGLDAAQSNSIFLLFESPKGQAFNKLFQSHRLRPLISQRQQ